MLVTHENTFTISTLFTLSSGNLLSFFQVALETFASAAFCVAIAFGVGESHCGSCFLCRGMCCCSRCFCCWRSCSSQRRLPPSLRPIVSAEGSLPFHFSRE